MAEEQCGRRSLSLVVLGRERMFAESRDEREKRGQQANLLEGSRPLAIVSRRTALFALCSLLSAQLQSRQSLRRVHLLDIAAAEP